MTARPASESVITHGSQEALAAAVAARLVTTIIDAQAARGSASVVLTGGRTGIAVLEGVSAVPAREAVDWCRVDLYWGDERFLPAQHPDRNETQAREALLDHLPLEQARVHPMAAAGGTFGVDADAAAANYAQVLADASGEGTTPAFDVCLLGVGEEGHTASIFPGSPAAAERTASVVAVHDCPKPPPTRISLTLPTIRRAAQVWLITTGEAKAEAVATALGGADETELPAAGAYGTERTLWLLDHTAASGLPG